ncbi:MAG TPA: ATP-binding protein [Aestuariivirgaceae bacterium]|nr:ATP-binding protein [Aestuariivirgaceae bacterium]
MSFTRVNVVYFALASFNILAILAGLYLSSQFANVFQHTVEFRQGWDKSFRLLWEANNLLMELNAPVSEVFQAGKPVEMSRKFEVNLRALSDTMVAVENELITSGRADAGQDVLAALQVATNTLGVAGYHGRMTFSNYYNGWVGQAAHCLSMTERTTSKLRHQIHGAMGTILALIRNYENDSISTFDQLKRYQFLIALVVIFMVACVTSYGHYIGRLIRRNHREILQSNERLEDSRANTLMFAAKLQTVNDDVTRLNQELAAKMKQLEDAQDENIRKGKLAQLGQLTAMVAHEVRNPLNTIRTAAYIIERKLAEKTEEIGVQLNRINKGIKRCDSIITELLDFTKSRALQLETVEVDVWLAEAVYEQAQKLPDIVKVQFIPGLPGVSACFDASRMYRVVVNLLANASEAMVGKGDDPSTFTTQTPRIVIATRRGTQGIEIICTDNGPGISEENLAKIREPLFTTKTFGVGLGLPAVEKALTEHGGGLHIQSQLDLGTTMTAWFPMDLGKQEAA